jgi:hypothetical protein
MIDLQQIFKIYSAIYKETHKLPLNQLKAISSIEACRTARIGGHVYECDTCGETKVVYNSCRNRHCPKCQGLAKESWLEDRKKDLMPIKYFHVVFTIPSELNDLSLRNQKSLYSILFRAASETLMEVSKDPKFLGANVGFMSILHTWGQNLIHHPHLHCIVTGGGLSHDGMKWIHSRSKFFVPVKVLSKKFRGKFLAYLKEAYYTNKLKLVGQIDYLVEKFAFETLIDGLYNKDWVVYCKPPFKNTSNVLEYLGRYTHKVAISNSRIEKFENGLVTFKWKDYKDKNKIKHMTLEASEFIRRFLMHVLPDKFVKIRHYGILSNRNRNLKLKKCKKLTGAIVEKVKAKLSIEELMLKVFKKDIALCPCCSKGKLLKKKRIHPKAYSPPLNNTI